MPEFNKIVTKEQLQEAISRNKRFGIKQSKSPEKQQEFEIRSFLEWYVFDRLGTSPKLLVDNIQTQYYAEQSLRDRRQRNVDFARGRQFNEIVYDSETQTYTTQFNYLSQMQIFIIIRRRARNHTIRQNNPVIIKIGRASCRERVSSPV